MFDGQRCKKCGVRYAYRYDEVNCIYIVKPNCYCKAKDDSRIDNKTIGVGTVFDLVGGVLVVLFFIYMFKLIIGN